MIPARRPSRGSVPDGGETHPPVRLPVAPVARPVIPPRSIFGEKLTVCARGAPLLTGVDVRIDPGTITAVVGPNGAGKSTLLRLLAGELEPCSGRVWLDGRTLDDWAPRDVARRRAVLPQASTLGFGFPVREVVLLGRMPHSRGFEGPRDRRICDEALRRVGAAHLADRVYPTLSGGERQRVHLARVLAQVWEPVETGGRYLLLDEPLASLDLGRQHEVLELIRSVAADGAGVLIVLHDLNLAARYADELLVLRGGSGLARGRPETVLVPELVEHAFDVRVTVDPAPEDGAPFVRVRGSRAEAASISRAELNLED